MGKLGHFRATSAATLIRLLLLLHKHHILQSALAPGFFFFLALMLSPPRIPFRQPVDNDPQESIDSPLITPPLSPKGGVRGYGATDRSTGAENTGPTGPIQVHFVPYDPAAAASSSTASLSPPAHSIQPYPYHQYPTLASTASSSVAAAAMASSSSALLPPTQYGLVGPVGDDVFETVYVSSDTEEDERQRTRL